MSQLNQHDRLNPVAIALTNIALAEGFDFVAACLAGSAVARQLDEHGFDPARLRDAVLARCA